MKSSFSLQITKRTCKEKPSHRLGPCKSQGGSLLHHEKTQQEHTVRKRKSRCDWGLSHAPYYHSHQDASGTSRRSLTTKSTALPWEPLASRSHMQPLTGFTSHSFRAKQPPIQDKYGMTGELHTCLLTCYLLKPMNKKP